MTDSIADRTHRAAVQMWESAGLRGPKPAREDYDHLTEVPDPAPVADLAAHRDEQGPTAEAVKAALRAMQETSSVRPPTDPAA